MTTTTCPDCGCLLEADYAAGHRPGCPLAPALPQPSGAAVVLAWALLVAAYAAVAVAVLAVGGAS